MYSLYLTSISGEKTNNCKSIVRVEFLGGKETISKTYYFKKLDFDKAKLKALSSFFVQVIFPLEKENDVDLTIYLDSDKLFYDYKLLNNNELSKVEYPIAWANLMALTIQLKLIPFFKPSGALSVIMRDELHRDVQALAINRETLTN